MTRSGATQTEATKMGMLIESVHRSCYITAATVHWPAAHEVAEQACFDADFFI